jgi:hypothetical protein
VTGQTATISVRCECGGEAVRQVSQFVLRDELWWDAEFSCDACGTHMCEHSGLGAAPDDVRTALLAAHGRARLRLCGPAPSLVPVLKVLRDTSSLSLSQARALAGELSGDGLTGTLTEMELLGARLRAHGVAVDLERG